jgi:MFS family permease
MMALVMPSRQAFLPEVVGLRRLMNAIPLQSAGMNLMQIMAPTLGGFMIDWIGPGSVYTFMAAMYAMSVIMLFRVKSLSPEEQEEARAGTAAEGANNRGPRATGRPQRRGGTLAELKGGFSYLFKDHTVLSILAFAFLGSVLGMPIRMLLAGYVADVFDDSGTTLGLLQMGMGMGALLGALGLASLRMTHRRGLLLAGSSALMGIAMLGFGSTEMKLLAWIGLFVIGIGSAGRQAMSQVLVQEYVQDEYRGRVMSIFMMQFSLMSVGTFVVSLYMEAVGPEFAIQSLGIVLLSSVILYLLLVPRFRRLA